MALRAGTKNPDAPEVDPYDNSMAAAMEHAFLQEWPYIIGGEVPPTNDHMRLLFIAVSQGVIKYLTENKSSITVNTGSGNTSIEIQTEGTLY